MNEFASIVVVNGDRETSHTVREELSRKFPLRPVLLGRQLSELVDLLSLPVAALVICPRGGEAPEVSIEQARKKYPGMPIVVIAPDGEGQACLGAGADAVLPRAEWRLVSVVLARALKARYPRLAV